MVETSAYWRDLVYLEQVGSTNDVAKDLASRGAPAGTVVVTDEQTAGRGRLDRHWVAPPCSGLLCSILFRPDLRAPQAHRMTMLCSLAAADAIERLANLPVALKWPNDLIVRSRLSAPGRPEWRKLAGLLTESGLTNAALAFVVVGIGINVGIPPAQVRDLAPNATSILAETGDRVDRSMLLIHLLREVEARYRRLEHGEGPHGEWAARLATLGQRVRVATSAGPIGGVAEGVTENGALLLRTDDGLVRELFAGDVTLADP